jgi:hypothetical protein
VDNDKVGKFRFWLKTSNGTRTVTRDSVRLTASMLIGNGRDDRGRQCCRYRAPQVRQSCWDI